MSNSPRARRRLAAASDDARRVRICQHPFMPKQSKSGKPRPGRARAARANTPLRPLRDILVPHPRILFVGINPSVRSAEVGHHFASPGNPFWKLLHAARLVPEPITSDEDGRLVEWGLALTNVCARPTRSAAELGGKEMDRGIRLLARKIARLEPEIVAFVGVGIYRRFFRVTAGDGIGARPEKIGRARVFVLPNPSGLNAGYPGFRDKLVWFEKLRDFAEHS
jgi:TDG/mug DNA glycosylase family protein